MAVPVLRRGSSGAWVKLLQRKLNKRHVPVGPADGAFGPKVEHGVRAWQRAHRLGVDGIVGRSTWKSLGVHTGAPAVAPKGASGKALAVLAQQVVTGRYLGGVRPRYVYGGEENHFGDPRTWNRLDCSELTQMCVSHLTGRLWLDGASNQYANAGRHITVAQALRTPGALVYIYGSVGRLEPYIHHVAVSLGDGRTAEARSRFMSPNCGVWGGASSRFNRASLVSRLHY